MLSQSTKSKIGAIMAVAAARDSVDKKGRIQRSIVVRERPR
jgi:hypothetical protein